MEATWVKYSDNQIDYKGKSWSLTWASKQPRNLHFPSTSTEEQSEAGSAGSHEPIDLLSHLRVTEVEREQLCEYFYKSPAQGRGSGGHDPAFQPSTNSGNQHAADSEHLRYDVDSRRVLEHESLVWQSFNEWIEIMFPDASRGWY
ncbi:hypothetical protein ACJZ2D_013278 [Fusarium nematophilum]